MANANEPRWTDDARQLESTITALKSQHSARLNLDKALLRLYYQRPVSTTGDPDRPYEELSTFETLQQLGFNRTKKAIDSLIALTWRKLTPKVISVGGDIETQQACKVASRLVDGVFDVTKYWRKARLRRRDAMTSTLGALEWYTDATTGEIKCSRVDPLCVYWHYEEGPEPAHLYVEEPASRVMLAARFPKHKAEIMSAPSWRLPTVVGVEPPGVRGADTVKLCKGWRRRLGDTPGVVAMTVGKTTLVEDAWDWDFFPVVWDKCDDDFRGLGGVPLARGASAYHLWSNTLVRLVYESMRANVPWIVQHEDAIPQSISDVPHQTVTWSGPPSMKPEIVANNTVSTQVLDQIANLDREMMEEFGISQQASVGSRPTGLNSAPAQREWMDNLSVRLQDYLESQTDVVSQDARVVVALASDAYGKKGLRIVAPGTDLLEEIKWPLELKESQFEVRFAVSSGLSQSISHRMEQAGELRDRGAMDEGDYLRAVANGVPDVAAMADRINAPRDLALQQISRALDECKFEMPSEMQGQAGLQAIVNVGAQEYQRALFVNVNREEPKYPPQNLECLRRLIKAAEARIKGLAAKPAEPVRPVPATLPGQPGGMAPMPSAVLPAIDPTAAMPANDNAVPPAMPGAANDNAAMPTAQPEVA